MQFDWRNYLKSLVLGGVGVIDGWMTTENEVGLVCGCFRVAHPASDIHLICRGVGSAHLRSYLAPSGLWVRSLGEGELLKATGQWGQE